MLFVLVSLVIVRVVGVSPSSSRRRHNHIDLWSQRGVSQYSVSRGVWLDTPIGLSPSPAGDGGGYASSSSLSLYVRCFVVSALRNGIMTDSVRVLFFGESFI